MKGLNNKVIGNSFIISTKQRIPPAIIDFVINGIVIFVIVLLIVLPRVLLAEKIFGDVLLNPETTEPNPIALNLIKYAINKTSMVPLKKKLDSDAVTTIENSLVILSKKPAVTKTPIANIVPGKA